MEAERARELLARERARIEGELRGIAPDANGESEATGDDAAELYEAELDAGQAEDLRAELAAVERAEERLADGKFGLSVESGEPIPDAAPRGRADGRAHDHRARAVRRRP